MNTLKGDDMQITDDGVIQWVAGGVLAAFTAAVRYALGLHDDRLKAVEEVAEDHNVQITRLTTILDAIKESSERHTRQHERIDERLLALNESFIRSLKDK